MPIPDFQNLILPMLQLAADGAERRLSDAIEVLAQQFELSDDERAELLPSDVQPRFDNRVGWARTHLGKALLVESPQRGWFRITERGRELLSNPPERITVTYLLRYSEYAFRSKSPPTEDNRASVAHDGVDEDAALSPATEVLPLAALPQKLTAVDVAYEVLVAAGEPLHANEIPSV